MKTNHITIRSGIPLSTGTWRVFADATEGHALYDFRFLDDGTFHESGAEHNAGTYAENGDAVELHLVRVYTATARDGDGNERTEEISWSEWFSFERDGNTLSGTWTKQEWVFGYRNGLIVRDPFELDTVIFARPERPDDPG